MSYAATSGQTSRKRRECITCFSAHLEDHVGVDERRGPVVVGVTGRPRVTRGIVEHHAEMVEVTTDREMAK